MIAEDGRYEFLVGYIRGVIAVHGDFLKDDVAFLLEFIGIDNRGGDHVGNDVDGHRQVGVQHTGEVAGAFLRCGGV